MELEKKKKPIWSSQHCTACGKRLSNRRVEQYAAHTGKKFCYQCGDQKSPVKQPKDVKESSIVATVHTAYKAFPDCSISLERNNPYKGTVRQMQGLVVIYDAAMNHWKEHVSSSFQTSVQYRIYRGDKLALVGRNKRQYEVQHYHYKELRLQPGTYVIEESGKPAKKICMSLLDLYEWIHTEGLGELQATGGNNE